MFGYVKKIVTICENYMLWQRIFFQCVFMFAIYSMCHDSYFPISITRQWLDDFLWVCVCVGIRCATCWYNCGYQISNWPTKKGSLQSTKPARSPFVFRFFGVCWFARIIRKVERERENERRWVREKIGKNGNHTQTHTHTSIHVGHRCPNVSMCAERKNQIPWTNILETINDNL